MILECVPNASTSDPQVVEAIAAAAEAAGVHILDHHADPDHNRAVITAAGDADRMIEAMVEATAAVAERIDLERHRGVHPRLGVMDVVPFVPVKDTPMEAAIDAARSCARRIWRQLGIPCFLYGEATRGHRIGRLPDIRRSAFRTRFPDLGGAPHPTAGATVVGARRVLVAYNVNLRADLPTARAIAERLRESGGGLAHVRALGLPIPTRGLVQVSMNLVRPDETTIPDVYDTLAGLAGEFGAQIVEAELVGLAPAAAFAGRDANSVGLNSPPKILEEKLAAISAG